MDFTAIKTLLQADSDIPEWAVDVACAAIESACFSAAEIERKDTIIKEMGALVEKLKFELLYLRRIRFGRTSEALTQSQLDLFAEDVAIDLAEVEVAVEKVAPTQSAKPKPKREGAGRQPLPDHLRREDIFHDLDECQCGKCGGTSLKKIGEDITEKLNIVPAAFFVERHHYAKYACPDCETVVAEPVPPAIIDGGVACNALLAWIVVSKYGDHLPLYRIEKIGERSGVPLPRSNLAEWVGKTGAALAPLAARLAEMLLQREVLHADETPVPQLDPKAQKNLRAYLWVYRSNDLDRGPPPIVVFDYQPGRGGCHALAFLKEWRGHLMVDDYSGYKKLMSLGVTELGCMAHARRKFFDVHAASNSPIAAKALEFIARLYQAESMGRNLDASARKKLRAEESLPILADYHAWLVKTEAKAAPGSAIHKALAYSLRRWSALARYAETGNLPIDNNPVENTIRPIAVGKKNWLHVGSERAGKRAAAIQTLLGTAKLNGLEPMAWLVDTLNKLPTWPNSRLDELLPLRKPG